jgi:hypothetical protein
MMHGLPVCTQLFKRIVFIALDAFLKSDWATSGPFGYLKKRATELLTKRRS